jgi:hypothetical protein
LDAGVGKFVGDRDQCAEGARGSRNVAFLKRGADLFDGAVKALPRSFRAGPVARGAQLERERAKSTGPRAGLAGVETTASLIA